MNSAYKILKDAYYGRRVLVTGHTGFKGSWLCIWLKELGAEIIGYALDPDTPRNNFILSGISKQIIDVRGDIRDFNKLEQIFKKYSPEFVFHLAAQPLVIDGYEKPKDTYDVNVGGTVNILENCRKSESANIIINVTSDKCYENREWIWAYRENDPLGGYDPYSSSKGCSELITAAYRNSFFNSKDSKLNRKAISSVRAGNIIGGGDWAKNRIIPDCIRALEKNEPIKIRNPKSTRPWQYILEPIGGYLLLGARMAEESNNYCGAWNFGPEISSIIIVQELVELVLKHWGRGSWKKAKSNKKAHEAKFLALDISKAKQILGWKPSMNINEAIKQTIDWYKASQTPSVIPGFCKKEVQNYMKIMQLK
jgi:CDP-glucose 4,6-dehydratase